MTVTQLQPRPNHRPLRTILREFLANAIEGRDETDLNDLVALAYERLAEDVEMQEALAADALPALVAEAVQTLMHDRRQMNPGSYLATPRGFVTGAMIDGRAKQLAAQIFESVGGGQRKNLLARTGSDIDFAIAERDRNIAGLARWNAFDRECRNALVDDKQTVGERFTDAEFNSVWARHFADPK